MQLSQKLWWIKVVILHDSEMAELKRKYKATQHDSKETQSSVRRAGIKPDLQRDNWYAERYTSTLHRWRGRKDVYAVTCLMKFASF